MTRDQPQVGDILLVWELTDEDAGGQPTGDPMPGIAQFVCGSYVVIAVFVGASAVADPARFTEAKISVIAPPHVDDAAGGPSEPHGWGRPPR